jgi:hypothetical protein
VPPLWRAVLRVAAEWAVLVLLGGTLGIGTAEAVRTGWISERTVFTVYAVLIATVAAFVVWSARDAYLSPWDDWDDDTPDDPPALQPPP